MNFINEIRVKYRWREPYYSNGNFRFWADPYTPFINNFDGLKEAIKALREHYFESVAKENNWHLIEETLRPIIYHNGDKLVFTSRFGGSAEPDEDFSKPH